MIAIFITLTIAKIPISISSAADLVNLSVAVLNISDYS